MSGLMAALFLPSLPLASGRLRQRIARPAAGAPASLEKPLRAPWWRFPDRPGSGRSELLAAAEVHGGEVSRDVQGKNGVYFAVATLTAVVQEFMPRCMPTLNC